MSATETRQAVDERPRFNGAWQTKRFPDVFGVISTRGKQVETKDYLDWGRLPVVDQGKQQVVGFVDDGTMALECPPGGLVIFGDHTRILKFIDFDFVAGADGTQVLGVRHGNEAKYWYYLLDQAEIPNTGYNRHFKFVKALDLLAPTLPEQRAIAAALSDVDDLLQSLDRLIAKKRDVKQGAMQQLLTGTTRLPGFEGAWETKRLGDLLTIRHGKSQHEVESPDGAFPILASGGQIGTASRPLYDKPSVLIGRKGTIDQPQFMDSPFWTVDTLFYSEVHGDNDAKFLYFRFLLIDWMQQNEASGVPSLSSKTIERLEILAPKPDEQRAIADVLSDMDAEIDALEARRQKVAVIKQGMMQELLTGRTRLPIPEESTL